MMDPNSFETLATVQSHGDVRIAGVPFAPGTEVEVAIHPRRADPEDFRHAWKQVCEELRAATQSQSLTDEDIQQEVKEYRSQR